MARARKEPEKEPAVRPKPREEAPPDQRKVTTRQASYLEELTAVPAKELAGKQLAELEGILKWKIDPFLLLFRRVCGRVVRLDPGTGVLHGVPSSLTALNRLVSTLSISTSTADDSGAR